MGGTPLFIAACKGHETYTQLLLGAPGHQGSTSINQTQPMECHRCIMRRKMAASHACDCCWTHQGSKSTNPYQSMGGTPLFIAACKGHETCTRLLLGAPGINVNQQDSWDFTAVFAVQEGSEACGRLLLDAPGVEVNQPMGRHRCIWRRKMAMRHAHDCCWVHQGSTPIDQTRPMGGHCFTVWHSAAAIPVSKYSLPPQASTSIVLQRVVKMFWSMPVPMS